MKKVFIVLFFVISSVVSATNYYVSTSGKDTNDGLTQSTPWKTLVYAETHTVEPGSIIALRKGDTFTLATWLTINSGGTSGYPIIWDGSLWGSGANAIITSTTSWSATLIRIVNCKYLTIQNIIFDGTKKNNQGIVIGGNQSVYGGDHQNSEDHIIIQDCVINNIGDASENYHSILVQTWENDMSHIIIQSNSIDYVAGSGVAFYCGRSVMGATPAAINDSYIGYNTINNYSTAGTAESILINNKVVNCIIEHNTTTTGPNSSAASGIVIGAGEYDAGSGKAGWYPINLIAKYNDIRTVDYPALYIQGCQAQSLTFYCNKYFQSSTGTVAKNGVIRIDKDYSALTYSGADIKFYNNTIVSSSGNSSCFSDASAVNGVVTLKNNIMVNTASSGTYGLVYIATSGSTLHSNNSYFRSAIGDLIYANIGSPSSQLNRTDTANWESTCKGSDPKLFNLAGFDWTLKEGSPCINAGIAIEGIASDFNGEPFSNPPNIGCYSTPVITSNLNYISSVIANAFPTILEMTYNMILADEVPPAYAFTVMVSSVSRAVSSVSISGMKVLLNLANPIVYGDDVTVVYIKPASNPLKTTSGGEAATISAQTVTNRVAAIPVYIGSSIENATPGTLEMTYDLNLDDIIPATSSFNVQVNFLYRNVSSITITGTKVQLTLTSAAVYGDVVSVTYYKPSSNSLQTTSGGMPTNITNKKVTNNIDNPLITQIKKDLIESKITIYPNPVHEYFNVSFNEPILKTQTIRIFNRLGAKVFEDFIESGIDDIQFPIKLSSGLYFVQLISDGIILNTLRLIVH